MAYTTACPTVQAVTRLSTDVICFILRLLRHCGSCTDMDGIN